MTRATEAELLKQRIAENRASQEIDLATWIFQRVRIRPGDYILELCCGTGGQTIPMLQALAGGGRVIALDASAQALAALAERAGSLASRLTALEGDLDNLPGVLARNGLEGERFDLVFVAYGLYYSSDARATLENLFSLLKHEGRIVVVGPFGPNNGPLFELLGAAGVVLSDAVRSSSGQFMTERVLPWAALRFESMRISTMVNKIHWNSPERVQNYWRNSTFYDDARASVFAELLHQHFSRCTEFVNEKWVMLAEMYDAR
jgi:ubiquinone/menaquinone biosynthesis C-methylase UbiE